ncbi:MAG: serine/threonine protein kinase [Gemmatimonadota bacterium]|nr:serine/threonine protein kinase [Gemmatimonadota bacterium]
MTDHLRDRVAGAIGDRYLVEAELGRGGMSVVYRALDRRLHRRVAVKVLPPELAFNAEVRERFLREAQTAAQLNHPSIVPIYTVDERDGVVYFVMALIEGESVAALLRRGPSRRPFDEIQRVLCDVADALAFAHARGVVHRDVKPDNILIEGVSGRPIVTDFGIARAAEADSRLTVTGVAMGTPAYMSPEQALGERDVDGRSDIYSLGVVGYQMLAGEPPFAASNTPALLMKHVSEPPRPVTQLRPDAPPALVGAITRALAKRPEERWRDAAQFRDAVAGVGAAGAAANAIAGRVLRAEGDEERGQQARADARAGALWAGGGRTSGSGGQRERSQEPPRHRAAPWQSPSAARTHPPAAGTRLPAANRRAERHAERAAARRAGDFDQRPVEERVVVFRRKLAGSATTIGLLAAINMLTVSEFWWFLFPTAFLTVDILSKAGSLWADGVRFRQVFGGRRRRAALEAAAAASQGSPAVESPAQYAARLVSPEVLNGPHGRAVLRAAADRAAILDVVGKLGKADREMIPDVAPTVEALAQRVGSVASTLHRLDEDVSGTPLASLDQRLAALRADPETAERERRLMLLERQRATLADLFDRRRALHNQLESAGLALENLKLDLYKLRSAGITASISDVTSATQQARAVSREIGHVLEAADDVKKL